MMFEQVENLCVIVGDNVAAAAKRNSDGTFGNIRYFQSDYDLQEFINAMKNPRVRVFVDNSDMKFLYHTLPDVKGISVDEIAAKRLALQSTAKSITGLVQIDKQFSGRRDWIYTFIYLDYTENEWIDAIEESDAVIMGVHFLPVEMYTIIERTVHDLAASERLHTRVDVLVLQNNTSGLRLASYRGGKIISSKIIRRESGLPPSIIAGKIAVDVNLALNQLSKLSLLNARDTNVTLILDNEIKEHIRERDFTGCNLTVLAVDEVAPSSEELFLNNVGEPIISANTKLAAKRVKRYNILRALNYVMILLLLAICLVLVYEYNKKDGQEGTFRPFDLWGMIDELSDESTRLHHYKWQPDLIEFDFFSSEGEEHSNMAHNLWPDAQVNLDKGRINVTIKNRGE
jgi:hypothetical protein